MKKLFFLILFQLVISSLFSQDLYWEFPLTLNRESSDFFVTGQGADSMFVAFPEYIKISDDQYTAFISIQKSRNGNNWQRYDKVIGPFTLNRKYPFFSMAVEENGTILISVLENTNLISLYKSGDEGRSFNFSSLIEEENSSFSNPRLFFRKNNGYILLFNDSVVVENALETENIPTLFYIESENGRIWSKPKNIIPLDQQDLLESFQPFYITHNKTEFIIYAVYSKSETQNTYQLYMQYSDNNRKSWSLPKRITTMNMGPADNEIDKDTLNNQRPFLFSDIDGLHLTWERGPAGEFSEIFYATLDENGFITTDQVTSNLVNANDAKMVRFKGINYITWFDDRDKETGIYLAYKEFREWREEQIGFISAGSETAPVPIINNNKLHIVWQNEVRNGFRIAFLNQDTTVPTPVLTAVNFNENVPVNSDLFKIRWRITEKDSTGTVGYNYSIDDVPYGVPPDDIVLNEDLKNIEEIITRDGTWYFHVRMKDIPGNWSETATISFTRDTKPPGNITFNTPDLKEDGALKSNSAVISWEGPEKNLGGYVIDLKRISKNSEYDGAYHEISLSAMKTRISSYNNSFTLDNEFNGVYAIRVSAVDRAGNIGSPVIQYFKLNDYIVETIIASIKKSDDDLGEPSLEFNGLGYNAAGRITKIRLSTSRSSSAVPDYEFTLANGDFRIVSDRKIDRLSIDDVDEGEYWVSLVHPRRGSKYSVRKMKFESTGAVKFGNFSVIEGNRWQIFKEKLVQIPFNSIFLIIIILLLVISLIFIITRVGSVAAEMTMLKGEAKFLLLGSPQERISSQKRILHMKKKGVGLRIKFTMLITSLVMIIVALVAIPLGVYMTDTQEKNLALGLEEKARVLLSSYVSSFETSLLSQNTGEMARSLSLMDSLFDAQFVTLTGQGKNSEDIDFYWISSIDDQEIEKNLTAAVTDNSSSDDNESLLKDGALANGVFKYIDEVSDPIEQFKTVIYDKILNSPLPSMNKDISLAFDKSREHVQKYGIDEKADIYESLKADLVNKENRFIRELNDLFKDEFGTYPLYNNEKINRQINEYVFFKPILIRDSRDDIILRGMVRLGISTESINEQVKSSQQVLFILTFGIAALAIAIGIIGALALASLIIRPIRKLVDAVRIIKDTEDKEDLKDHKIVVKTKDEISLLADSINQMTMGLVKAAVASKDLTVGKEVQKMFIPLEKDSSGKKLTTGKDDLPEVSFFGYYEGAKGVSGDYFDFQRLDDTYYAIIKCDVAGKGVPASLIMVEVATIFIDHFKAWNPKKPNMNLVGLVNRINDLLEERGFKGRFAALSIVLMNIKTGKCLICHAGDKLLTYYDGQQQKVIIKELPEIPATGVFPTMMLEMRGGFQQVPHTLKSGDTLFMATDGIEESQRLLRNEQFEPISIPDENAGEGEHAEISKEEFTVELFHEIVEKVYTKGVVKVKKMLNPVKDEELVFDFASLEGTVEDAVMALISIEKIWRLYPDPKSTFDNRIQMDKKVDVFLQNTFNRYSQYFHSPVPQESESEYVYYGYLKEDEQFDDLTILGVKKK